MIEIFPSYYHKFECISSSCKYNCCIGWEIDIDQDTLKKYKEMQGSLGDKIRSNIEGNPPHFILAEKDRCPMLCDNGLCEIIKNCGEQALCEICSQHPRFRNFYTSFTETGLGLCCEEAARIVVSETAKFSLKLPQDVFLLDEEADFLAERDKIFKILQNREIDIGGRLRNLAHAYGIDFAFSMSAVSAAYLSLERLCDRWTDLLRSLKTFGSVEDIFHYRSFQLAFEQISCYFVFRHFSEVIWDGDYTSRIKFVLVSCAVIAAICIQQSQGEDNISNELIADVARMYSSEIEYSEENMESLLDLFSSDSII